MFQFNRTFSAALTLAVVCLLQASAIAVRAQDRSSSADNELLLSGDPLVVTASKTELRIQDAPVSVAVIDENTIAASGAMSIPDLLRSVAGVDVMESNQSQSNVAIRGLNKQYSDKLLVMIDGRSIYQDYFGDVFWRLNPLLMSQIKRIEVVRGPGSALYGANAFSGTINIITKTPREQQQGLAVRVAAGERDGQFLNTTYTGRTVGGWAYSFGAGYDKSSGFGERQPGQVRDSYSVPTYTADFQKELSHGGLRISMGDAPAIADLSATTFLQDGHWDTRNFTVAYSEDKSVNPVSARLFINKLTLNSTFASLSDTTSDLEVQKENHISPTHDLIYGTSFRQIVMKSTQTGSGSHNTNLKSIFIQDEWKATRAVTLFTGVRLDSDSLNGSNISPRIGMVRHVGKNQVFRASYGTAFRAPTLINSYLDTNLQLFPGVALHTIGNPDLKPEKIKSYELGYRVDIKNGFVGVNTYYNQATDLINAVATEFAPSPPFPAGIPIVETFKNTDRAQIHGLEIESELRLKAHGKVSVNYSYEDVRVNGAGGYFAPQHKANVGYRSDPLRRFSYEATAHFVGASQGQLSDASVQPLSAYTRIDANLRFRLAANGLSMEIGGTNILDDRHLELPISTNAQSLPEAVAQGRTLWVSFSNRF